ncbi:MAG: CocE/NonD family hydrolase [Gemmatimonadaceae bacterium]|nr:CocE/NonD family hydrolase [Gemmatimonadaceae bacterium]
MSHHPALAAVSPQAPLTDMFFEDYHHNGALTQGYFTSYPIFGIPRPAPTPDHWWLPAFLRLDSLSQPDDYRWQLSLGAVSTFGRRFYPGNTLWRDITAHPNYDAFWQNRSAVRPLRGVTAAVLVVGGWFDGEDLYGPFAVARALRRNNPGARVSMVVGPFGHRGWTQTGSARTMIGKLYFGDSLALRYQREVEAPFFRGHLKSEGAGPPPDALMFDTGRKAWRTFANWPAAAQQQRFYFHTDGTLSRVRPEPASALRQYVSDPRTPVPTGCEGPTLTDFTHYMADNQRCFDGRPDVLTFQSDVLTEDLTVAGPISASLRVSISGTDADFVVKLIDVYPMSGDSTVGDPTAPAELAGYQQLVRGEIMPGRFRNSFARPAPFRPDQAQTVTVALQDVLHTFRRGHRLMVQVQSSWFPMFARNPQTYFANQHTAPAASYKPITVRVSTGGGDASAVDLPIIRGGRG